MAKVTAKPSSGRTRDRRELAGRLWKCHPETRVLFTSGYTEDMIVRHGVVDSVMHYIGKPYSLQALALKVRRVLDAPASGL